MVRWVLVGAVTATAVFAVAGGQKPAFACTKTNGCNHDVANEDHEMMRDGRMEKAMKAGQDNIEAFRALQAKQRAYSTDK